MLISRILSGVLSKWVNSQITGTTTALSSRNYHHYRGRLIPVPVLAHEAYIFVPTGPGTISLPTTCRATQCSVGVEVEPNLLNGIAGVLGLLRGCARCHCVAGDLLHQLYVWMWIVKFSGRNKQLDAQFRLSGNISSLALEHNFGHLGTFCH